MKIELSFEYDLGNMKRLQKDSEEQLLNFNEIVPYEQNPSNIYSPKLVNLILQVGPQVENLIDLIMQKFGLTSSRNGVPSRIDSINKKGVLSNLQIVSSPHGLLFTPFTKDLRWWDDYQKTKHDLSKFQFKVTYLSVMQSFAALAGLHRLADAIEKSGANSSDQILDRKNWKEFAGVQAGISIDSLPVALDYSNVSWKSQLFKIKTYYIYDHKLEKVRTGKL